MSPSRSKTPSKALHPAEAATDRLCQRVKQLRQARRWTLEQLAQASSVSRSMLSQIERRTVNPTFHVAYRIAHALGVSLGELVDADERPRGIEVIRADDRHYHFRDELDHSVRTLYPMHLEKDVEFYEVKLRPAGVLASPPHLEGTREFLTVQRGRVRVRSGAQSVVLESGDSARYFADVAHELRNEGRGEALAFLVAIYQPDANVRLSST
jgi:transcriptional regulator with XRE-family HTH domain